MNLALINRDFPQSSLRAKSMRVNRYGTFLGPHRGTIHPAGLSTH